MMGEMDHSKAVARRFRPVYLFMALALGAAIVLAVLKVLADPGIPLLLNEGGAQWIRFPKPFALMMHDPARLKTAFRWRFDVREVPAKAHLALRALKQATVSLDGRLLLETPEEPSNWKKGCAVDLGPALTQGSHELRIDVVNANGPPALWARCPELGVFSGSAWEVSLDGRQWLPALPADRIEPFAISRTFPRTDRALASLLPLFLPLFLVVFLWDWRLRERLRQATARRTLPPVSTVRWLILAGWVAMAAVNFHKLPLSMGMDYAGHATYITYVAQSWRVPLATEGWQMFQPPLFYFLEAAFFRLFLTFFNPETVVRLLKLLPLLCGMAQVQICYLTLKTAFPGRPLPQLLGLLIGGLLPMNLYMSQSLGNEPLAACLTALAVYGVCRVVEGSKQPAGKMAVYLGFTLGLALLSKVTPVLLIPPILLFASLAILDRRSAGGAGAGGGAGEAVRFAAVLCGMVLAVAGWYYLRNWMETGRIFIGGWDLDRDIAWWQDPGYRTLWQCLGFGESLFYPVYSSIYGFWDALYSTLWADGFLSEIDRPPWNYRFMLSGIWLSLIPSAAIVRGAILALKRGNDAPRQILRFCTACLLVVLAAIYYLFLSVPTLSSAKATYALGLTPCLAVLGAAGFEALASNRVVRALLVAAMACWATASYLTYLVL